LGDCAYTLLQAVVMYRHNRYRVFQNVKQTRQ